MRAPRIGRSELHDLDGLRFRRHRQRKQPVPRKLLRVVDQVSPVRRPVGQREPEAGQPEHQFLRASAVGANPVDQLSIDLADVIGDLASIRRPDDSRHEVLGLVGGELDALARVRVHDPDLSRVLDDRHARAVGRPDGRVIDATVQRSHDRAAAIEDGEAVWRDPRNQEALAVSRNREGVVIARVPEVRVSGCRTARVACPAAASSPWR